MTIVNPINNCVFVIDNAGDCHCFSYNSEVTAIINGEYKEYEGYQFYSRTSNKHKRMFREHFGIGG